MIALFLSLMLAAPGCAFYVTGKPIADQLPMLTVLCAHGLEHEPIGNTIFACNGDRLFVTYPLIGDVCNQPQDWICATITCVGPPCTAPICPVSFNRGNVRMDCKLNLGCSAITVSDKNWLRCSFD
jgi:hypothetical protein